MNAGSITISTELDNKELETQYAATIKKIRSLTDKINAAQAKRSPAADQSAAVAAELDAAKAQLDYMKSGQEFFTAGAIQQQEASVKSIQKDWNSAQASVEKYDAQIAGASTELSANEEKAGAIASEMTAAGRSTSLMGDGLDAVGIRMNKLFMRIQKLAARILFFSVITMGLRSVREWLGNVIKTNGEASQAVAQLRAALLTLAQPLVNVVIPAFTFFVRVLTQVIMTIASLFSALSGTTVEQSEKSAEALNGETSALKGTGAAAKKAAKSLAAFDEINQLSSAGSSTAGGGSSSNGATAPDFTGLDNASDKIKTIADLVLAVGAGLLLWKISSMFTSGLANVAQLCAGLALTFVGLTAAYKGFTDAWENGISWDNFAKMIGGVLAIAGGLFLTFSLISKTAGVMAAALTLIVGGLAMVVTGFHDVIESGANLKNTLTVISGILLAGVGFSMLTKSWIPLAIAGIASLIYFAAYATGHAQELMQGVNDFLTGVFTANWSLAWTGIKEIALAVWDSIRDAGKLLWTNITTKMATAAKWMQDNVWTPLDKKVNEFVENVHLTWIGFINGLISAVESFVNFFIGGINDIIGAINAMISAAAAALSITGKSVKAPQIPIIPEIALPRLATGAVIPPNREFMAVLGDQKHGTNIEAPEGLLRQMANDAAGANADILREIRDAIRAGKVLMLDRRELGRAVVDVYGQESRRVGVSLL